MLEFQEGESPSKLRVESREMKAEEKITSSCFFFFSSQDCSASALQISCIARSYVSEMLSEVNIDLHLWDYEHLAKKFKDAEELGIFTGRLWSDRIANTTNSFKKMPKAVVSDLCCSAVRSVSDWKGSNKSNVIPFWFQGSINVSRGQSAHISSTLFFSELQLLIAAFSSSILRGSRWDEFCTVDE